MSVMPVMTGLSEEKDIYLRTVHATPRLFVGICHCANNFLDGEAGICGMWRGWRHAWYAETATLRTLTKYCFIFQAATRGTPQCLIWVCPHMCNMFKIKLNQLKTWIIGTRYNPEQKKSSVNVSWTATCNLFHSSFNILVKITTLRVLKCFHHVQLTNGFPPTIYKQIMSFFVKFTAGQKFIFAKKFERFSQTFFTVLVQTCKCMVKIRTETQLWRNDGASVAFPQRCLWREVTRAAEGGVQVITSDRGTESIDGPEVFQVPNVHPCDDRPKTNWRMCCTTKKSDSVKFLLSLLQIPLAFLIMIQNILLYCEWKMFYRLDTKTDGIKFGSQKLGHLYRMKQILIEKSNQFTLFDVNQ